MRKTRHIGELFSAADIVGKDLFAKANVNIRVLPDVTSKIVQTAKAGSRLGTVYSYVNRNGQIWWYLNNPTGYVLHNASYLDTKALKEQGAKSTEQKIQEQEDANKTVLDKLKEGLSPTLNTLKWAVPAFLIGWAVIELSNKRSVKKSYV